MEGFDWGAAASKVILTMNDAVSAVEASDYEIVVKKSTSCMEMTAQEANGKLKVLYGYASDAKANRMATGTHITLVLYAAPFESINAPIKYFPNNDKCRGNQWIDFDLTISNKVSGHKWDNEVDRIIPLIDDFDLEGSFTHKGVELTYASYMPEVKAGKSPLIIWLHGGGEGGTDTTIPLIANRAANYAAPEIQSFFDGAYVLVPQTPTFWMDKGNGEYTRGDAEDLYNESLLALIKSYANENTNIDQERIYLGGCSNGGYMTMKLLFKDPEYFAAAFPSALAMHNEFITDAQIESIKHVPIWFIHSADDPVTKAAETVVPLYHRMIKAGAKDVHFSYFDHVVDITNQFGGEDYHYMGHFSWIYSHANKCQLDFDETPVKVDGRPVSLMAWMASKEK